jgi:hypothetical protein
MLCTRWQIMYLRYFLQQNWVRKQVDSDTFVSGNFTFHYKCHPLATLFPLPDSIPWSIHAEVFLKYVLYLLSFLFIRL